MTNKITLSSVEYQMLLKIVLLADAVSQDIRYFNMTEESGYGVKTNHLHLEQAVAAYKAYEKRDTPSGTDT